MLQQGNKPLREPVLQIDEYIYRQGFSTKALNSRESDNMHHHSAQNIPIHCES